MKLRTLPICLVLITLPVFAATRTQNAPAPSPKMLPGFRTEFHEQLAEVEEKIIRLAEATPADKFGWRPAGDIRSISEVYMHIAGGNYFLSTFLGAKAPAHAGDIEKKVIRKADVIAELKKSFDHLHAAVENANDLDKPVKMFGKTTTSRAVMLTMLNHLHEHLGQSIAYARMNAVVPPWSH
jgi:uncharacterized damage-inducible protein DinB